MTSYMIANISFFFTTILYDNIWENFSKYIVFFDINTNTNSQEFSTSMTINMEVNTPRSWSISSNTNNSRSAFVLSNIFSKVYTKHI